MRGEGTNRFRRNALLAGSELALTGVFTAYFIVGARRAEQANPIHQSVSRRVWGFLLTCFVTRVFLLYRLVYRTTNKFAAPKVVLEFVNWTPVAVILLLSIFLNNCEFYNRIFPGRCVAPVEKLDLMAMILSYHRRDDEDRSQGRKKPVKEKVLRQQTETETGVRRRRRRTPRPEPPSKGVPPQMALTPQIVLPNPEPPKIKNPTLPVAMTTYGDPSLRMPKGPIGDPTGVPSTFPRSGMAAASGVAGTGVGGGAGGGAGRARRQRGRRRHGIGRRPQHRTYDGFAQADDPLPRESQVHGRGSSK